MLDLRRWKIFFRQMRKKYKGNPWVRRAGWGAVFFLAAVFIVGSGLTSKGYSFKEGQVCPTNIYAPQAIVYVDEEETEHLRTIAVDQVEKSYQEDTGVLPRIEQRLGELFEKIAELRDAELESPEKQKQLTTYLVQEVGVPMEEMDDTLKSSFGSLLEG